jgi:hypothetical protein
MNDIDDIEFKIARLELRPGDVLVVKYAKPLPDTTRQRLMAIVQEAAIGHRVLVLDGGLDLSVLTALRMAPEVISVEGQLSPQALQAIKDLVAKTVAEGRRFNPSAM